eukprot:1157661-Pelagomonas_calceolata.AAC.8
MSLTKLGWVSSAGTGLERNYVGSGDIPYINQGRRAWKIHCQWHHWLSYFGFVGDAAGEELLKHWKVLCCED